jgi:hypothetical protein
LQSCCWLVGHMLFGRGFGDQSGWHSSMTESYTMLGRGVDGSDAMA